MAQWTIILFSCFGLLHGQGERNLPTLQECCQDGRTRGQGGQDCTILPLISSSHTCRIAQEQCCAAVVLDKLCDNGIKLGRSQGACERPLFEGEPWETEISKMCCDCCMLGLMAASRGSGCELQGSLSLGRQCDHTAKACCGKNTEEDSICSQLCVGNGTCTCFDGYQLQKDGVHCEGKYISGYKGSPIILKHILLKMCKYVNEYIDECTLGTHNCGTDFLCSNTAGSFRCHPKERCTDGFIQDAAGSCIDINECLAHSNPCLPGHVCINTIGSYSCRRNTVTCGRGYHLTEDGTRCEDIDECRTGNVCGDHGCVNLLGSFRCECRAGFIFNSITKHCEDINECRYYPGRLCGHKCENTEGSYHCSCSTGFKLSHDGRNCDDVNECEANPCSQECANVYGSYQCYCRRGYQLSDIDGITCEDIDECALPAGGHVCSYRCFNVPGSFYCTCPPTGYTLSPNGRTCQDIDECAAGSHTCSVSESCFNTQGGHRCLSFQCPPNFRQAAQGSRHDSSASMRCLKSCQPNDVGCALDPVHLITHTVLSLPTFRDFSGPEEIVFLRTVVAANPVLFSGATDVLFELVSTDEQYSFNVVKRSSHGMILGVVQQVKPIVGPKDIKLEVAMNYVKSGNISHRNVVIIHIFISEFWF
uniref:Fibulin-1 n=1 Tax=Echeneis naucrates TaxID=173247 RepID=A0A665WL03_ECHNA